jgi:hypothetical protein
MEQEINVMSSGPPHSLPGPAEREEMLTPKEFARVLKVSISWLAKARKRGDGPPFMRVGKLVRYFPVQRPK